MTDTYERINKLSHGYITISKTADLTQTRTRYIFFLTKNDNKDSIIKKLSVYLAGSRIMYSVEVVTLKETLGPPHFRGNGVRVLVDTPIRLQETDGKCIELFKIVNNDLQFSDDAPIELNNKLRTKPLLYTTTMNNGVFSRLPSIESLKPSDEVPTIVFGETFTPEYKKAFECVQLITLKEEWCTTPYSRDILVLHGPSGIGKSFIANLLKLTFHSIDVYNIFEANLYNKFDDKFDMIEYISEHTIGIIIIGDREGSETLESITTNLSEEYNIIPIEFQYM